MKVSLGDLRAFLSSAHFSANRRSYRLIFVLHIFVVPYF